MHKAANAPPPPCQPCQPEPRLVAIVKCISAAVGCRNENKHQSVTLGGRNANGRAGCLAWRYVRLAMWPDREWKHAAAAAAAAAADDDDEGVGALPTWPVRTNNSVAVAAPTWRGENVLVVYGTNTCSSCAVLCCAVLSHGMARHIGMARSRACVARLLLLLLLITSRPRAGLPTCTCICMHAFGGVRLLCPNRFFRSY
jgi:hypothetical protein